MTKGWRVVYLLLLVSWQRSACQDANNVTTGRFSETQFSCDFDARDEDTVCDDTLPIDEGEDIGVKQDLSLEPDLSDDMQDAIQSARSYLAKFDFHQNKLYRILEEDCRNKHELCALWAVAGECQKSPLYMNLTCAPMCHSCEYLLPEVRCPLDPNAVNAWQPGDLNKMFERITTDPKLTKYQPRIMSRPDDHDEDISLIPPSLTINGSSSVPWIITLDRFMSTEEADHLQHYVKGENFNPKRIVYPEDEWKGDTTNTTTYSGKHCSDSACMEDTVVQTIMNRLTELTNIAVDNYEHLQFLRYQVGQFAATHTDYLIRDRFQRQGVRLFTVLMYLNDVEEGGGTYFNQLNVTITPRKGRALIWPNVLNENPNREERRTSHKGSPILKGKKYAAGIFVHQRNFRAPHAIHCVQGLTPKRRT